MTLCLATLILWVRSYEIADDFSWLNSSSKAHFGCDYGYAYYTTKPIGDIPGRGINHHSADYRLPYSDQDWRNWSGQFANADYIFDAKILRLGVEHRRDGSIYQVALLLHVGLFFALFGLLRRCPECGRAAASVE